MPELLYGSECWTLTNDQSKIMETSCIHSITAEAGYRMTKLKRNQDIGKEPEIAVSIQ